MGAACDRIVAAVRRKSIVPATIDLLDEDSDGSVSIGEWKDAINVELKTLREKIRHHADLLDALSATAPHVWEAAAFHAHAAMLRDLATDL
jgi:hypothetical protein